MFFEKIAVHCLVCQPTTGFDGRSKVDHQFPVQIVETYGSIQNVVRKAKFLEINRYGMYLLVSFFRGFVALLECGNTDIECHSNATHRGKKQGISTGAAGDVRNNFMGFEAVRVLNQQRIW